MGFVHLTVRVANHRDDTRAEQLEMLADSGALYSVVPAEVLARIGKSFFTTRESGTGLGIMLAQGVLAQHGGSLAYESTLGAGTTAVATLPISLMERTDPRVEAPARGR